MIEVDASASGEPVTLDDVARVSGVSRAAASRALNGRDGVRDDVRTRVRHVADSLGYRPNRAARTLASGRASVVGLIMPSEELRVDPYGASLLQAVANAADRHDEGLMLHLAASEPRRAVSAMLRDGLIDGVVVSAIALGSGWVDELLDARMPTVLLGGHVERADVHTVEVENVESTAALVAHLVDCGCRRIANIRGRTSRVDARQRFEGFRLGLERAGLELDPDLVVDGDYVRADARDVTTGLLSLRPDAIVAANDESAIGALAAIRAAGLRVPDDVAVVGFDGTAAIEGLDLELTTVQQPFEEMSDLAVRSIVQLVSGRDVPMQ
ncbi:MAG: LacI family DNA-binding transcriptional regulator, partial [Actinomycetota bacterium]